MQAKKIIIFFSLFVITVFAISYIGARKGNRKEYHFVIARYNEGPKTISFSNNDNEFTFSRFDPYVNDIEKEDSLVKKAFSEKVYIYRKNKMTDKYFLLFVIKTSGIFPITWL